MDVQRKGWKSEWWKKAKDKSEESSNRISVFRPFFESGRAHAFYTTTGDTNLHTEVAGETLGSLGREASDPNRKKGVAPGFGSSNFHILVLRCPGSARKCFQ